MILLMFMIVILPFLFIFILIMKPLVIGRFHFYPNLVLLLHAICLHLHHYYHYFTCFLHKQPLFIQFLVLFLITFSTHRSLFHFSKFLVIGNPMKHLWPLMVHHVFKHSHLTYHRLCLSFEFTLSVMIFLIFD